MYKIIPLYNMSEKDKKASRSAEVQYKFRVWLPDSVAIVCDSEVWFNDGDAISEMPEHIRDYVRKSYKADLERRMKLLDGQINDPYTDANTVEYLTDKYYEYEIEYMKHFS